MKNPFIILSLSFLSLNLSACMGEERAVPSSENEAESNLESQEWVELETIMDGEFRFVHKSQGENYYIDVVYKDQTIGQFFKELPLNGWKAYVFESTQNYAYLGLQPTVLEGELPFSGPQDLARVNLETGAFDWVIYEGYVNDVSADDAQLVYSSSVLPQVSVMNLSQALYPNGSNVKVFTPGKSFSYAGNAVFSPDGTKLAYLAWDSTETPTTVLFTVDLATGVQTQLLTQAGVLKITGWTGEQPSYE